MMQAFDVHSCEELVLAQNSKAHLEAHLSLFPLLLTNTH